MSESDALLTVETSHGSDPVRVIHDGAEQEPEREHWWPTTVSDDGEWESFV